MVEATLGGGAIVVTVDDGVSAAREVTLGGGLIIELAAEGPQGPQGSATRLSALADVLITNPQDGDILKYNAATGLWKNVPAV